MEEESYELTSTGRRLHVAYARNVKNILEIRLGIRIIISCNKVGCVYETAGIINHSIFKLLIFQAKVFLTV